MTENEELALEYAEYYVRNKSTMRKTAQYFGVSKSKVERAFSKYLPKLDANLYEEVCNLKLSNLNARYSRGGKSAGRIKSESSYNKYMSTVLEIADKLVKNKDEFLCNICKEYDISVGLVTYYFDKYIRTINKELYLKIKERLKYNTEHNAGLQLNKKKLISREKAIAVAKYYIETKSTYRIIGAVFNMPISSVHLYLNDIIKKASPTLAQEVLKVKEELKKHSYVRDK